MTRRRFCMGTWGRGAEASLPWSAGLGWSWSGCSEASRGVFSGSCVVVGVAHGVVLEADALGASSRAIVSEGVWAAMQCCVGEVV